MKIRPSGIVVLSSITMALLPTLAQAAKLTRAKADHAVKRRLVREYPIFGATYEIPGELTGGAPLIEKTEPSASCHRLTTTKYTCSWTGEAVANGLCGKYHGSATVTQYRYGLDVRLSKPIGGDSCGPDGVNHR
jgi:hypothetical protein